MRPGGKIEGIPLSCSHLVLSETNHPPVRVQNTEQWREPSDRSLSSPLAGQCPVTSGPRFLHLKPCCLEPVTYACPAPHLSQTVFPLTFLRELTQSQDIDLKGDWSVFPPGNRGWRALDKHKGPEQLWHRVLLGQSLPEGEKTVQMLWASPHTTLLPAEPASPVRHFRNSIAVQSGDFKVAGRLAERS